MKNNKREKDNLIKRVRLASMSFSQIIIMIVSIFAFSFIIGGMTIISTPEVSAVDNIPSGCCTEGIDGSICQNVAQTDVALCKTPLISTDCSFVDSCKSGCCFDPFQGTCSLNSPKQACTGLNGSWSSDKTCNVGQCQLGCCVLGEEAQLTTDRECTLKSGQFGFEKNYQALDTDGTCGSKTHTEATGACVIDASDGSGLNDCTFTTKAKCYGDFYENTLCTSKSLKTNCAPSKQTTCLEGNDKVYFLDSCGNLANVYDANKYDDIAYWNTIVDSSLCSSASPSCGNCDYTKGSKCSKYSETRDVKPTFGNNVCKNLDCANGRKHGESWCINDYNKTDVAGVAPLGSRAFIGKCVEGEISVEPCADFNQQICIQGSLQINNRTMNEAQCQTNNWRSCLAANAKTTYSEIQTECNKNSQCAMFLNLPPAVTGTGKSYIGLAGFKPGVDNSGQGSAGGIGKELNKVMAQCVPKYTPGMLFWQDFVSAGDMQNPYATVQRGLDTGGSYQETKAICAIGSFSCVSEKTETMTGTSWKNKECYDGTSPWVDGLNERCKMVGPCGMNVNIAGQMSEPIKNMSRMKLGGNPSPFSLLPSQQYLDSLKTKPGIIQAGSLNVITAAVIGILTGKVTYTPLPEGGNSEAAIDAAASDAAPSEGMDMMTSLGLGSMAVIGTYSILVGAAGTSLVGVIGITGTSIIAVAAAAIAGYVIGQLIGNIFGLSPGQTQALSYSLAVGAGLAVGATIAMASAGITTATTIAGVGISANIGLGAFCWPCAIVIVLIMILTYIFTYEDVTYYITNYECVPITAPVEGDCSLCNNDVRPCSDYRCNSLGQNCQYFTDNGEPGFCSDSQDIWSAKITPWQEALTGGNKYSQVTDTSFSVEGETSDKKVEAWQLLQFGIKTDKPAVCKIENKHTSSFNEMSTTMVATDGLGCLSGSCGSQGINHKVALSSHIGPIQTGYDTATLSMSPGINNYYIRCKNFAGQTNEAEFAVKIIVSEGPDLTAPVITSFKPASASYVTPGTNSSDIVLYVNEPSTCKFSETDLSYDLMQNNATCINDANQVYLGNWPCVARLNNLSTDGNKFYFKCKDHPELLAETATKQHNTAKTSKEYLVNVCKTGLDITAITPNEALISGKSPVRLTLQATTQGCISGGVSTCSYKFNTVNSSSEYAYFFETNSVNHKQVFTSMSEGIYNISIKCEDAAGNIAVKTTDLEIKLDNSAPQIIKVYNKDSSLQILTNEDSQCKYTLNSTIGCSFDYASLSSQVSFFDGSYRIHTTGFEKDKTYYIKCQDAYGNPDGEIGVCTMKVRTYSTLSA